MRKFVFTCGDINGIGPEIVIKTFNRIYTDKNTQLIFISPSSVFNETIKTLKPRFRYEVVKKFDSRSVVPVQIVNIGSAKINIGKPTKNSGQLSFKSLEYAFDLVYSRQVEALVTAPISKTAFNLAGIPFAGHTELLARWSGCNDYLMTFLSKKMNAALLSIHTPLKKVSRMITRERLKKSVSILNKMLRRDLNISEPEIAVLGLNPHAGENGLIGIEEERVIKPLIKTYKKNVSGPFSPDAFFASGKYKNYNMILGMYHDQVLIPFKMINFSSGVNYTAGLNIVRTSPDHGVAYDIAWQNRADENSIFQAYKYAKLISFNRKRNEKD